MAEENETKGLELCLFKISIQEGGTSFKYSKGRKDLYCFECSGKEENCRYEPSRYQRDGD